MSTLTCFYGEQRPVRIQCDDDGCVWLRDGEDTVALTLTGTQLTALRDAADEATRLQHVQAAA